MLATRCRLWLGALGLLLTATQAHASVRHERRALEQRVEVVRASLAREAAIGKPAPTSPLTRLAQWANFNNWSNWANR